MEICQFYKSAGGTLTPRHLIRGNRNPSQPWSNFQHWCEHEKSPKRKGVIGRLECFGDPDKCVIDDMDLNQ